MTIERTVTKKFDLFKVYIGLTIIIFYAAGGSKMFFYTDGNDFKTLRQAVATGDWETIKDQHETAIEYSSCSSGEY